jgi:uncharacterized LabA/DUF88 family protein
VRERLVVYVDGFNLYHGLHDAAGTRLLWLDLVRLSEVLRPRSQVVRVRYFTAPVLDQPDAASRQQEYQDALVALYGDRVAIEQGRYQSKQMKCRACGATWSAREEKETDVNIAVSLVSDAAARDMEAALLISADSDLAPAVRAAKRLHPGLFVAAAFPPKRFSVELKTLMSASFPIGMNKLRASMLPDEIVGAARTYRRPAEWSAGA